MTDKRLKHWLDGLRIAPGEQPELSRRDCAGKPRRLSRAKAQEETEAAVGDLDRLQYLLYADAGASLLIVLQGLDAAGKDGTIRHVMTGMNPQGVRVTPFKQPTPDEAGHDFLWRVHRAVPGRGEVAIFNRSHYEDVLVVRVHKLVPEEAWRARYDEINHFEALLAASGTRILKFFLHLSAQEQLDRFARRLEDPARQWKISEADYTERPFWPQYQRAYEEALSRCSTELSPWYVIPANHKWFRDLTVARIVVEGLEAMDLRYPEPDIDLARIRRQYHAAAAK